MKIVLIGAGVGLAVSFISGLVGAQVMATTDINSDGGKTLLWATWGTAAAVGALGLYVASKV